MATESMKNEIKTCHEEFPYVLFSIAGCTLDLGLAIRQEGAGLECVLQIFAALQELRLRGHLADQHLAGHGLGALHRR